MDHHYRGSVTVQRLNVFKPVMIHNFLHSARLLRDVSRGFIEFCINGIKLNRERIRGYVERSLELVTALNQRIGYDQAAKLAHVALEENLSLRDANRKLGILPEDEFERLVRPEERFSGTIRRLYPAADGRA